jgi:hypothetical protein
VGCYKVLSNPMHNIESTIKYKGLYRSEPFPKSDTNKRFMSLWNRYCGYYEPLYNMGITTELTLSELKEFAILATQETGESFEVIYFSYGMKCLHESLYYGADVTGVGGYSMVGGDFFTDGISPVLDIINQHFEAKLNQYGLFSTNDDAMNFLAVLLELDKLNVALENEDWRVVHVFRVI